MLNFVPIISFFKVLSLGFPFPPFQKLEFSPNLKTLIPKNGDHRRTKKTSRSESISSTSETQSADRIRILQSSTTAAKPMVTLQVPKDFSRPHPKLHALHPRSETRNFPGQTGSGYPISSEVPGQARNLLPGLLLSHPSCRKRVCISGAGGVLKETK